MARVKLKHVMQGLAAVAGLALIALVAASAVRVRSAIERFDTPLVPKRQAPPPPKPVAKVETPPVPKVVVKVEPPPKVDEPTGPIVPAPKVYKESGKVAELLGPGAAAIVLGDRASEPERYAAERLQGLIQRRFRRQLPVLAEAAVGEGVRQVLLLGQRGTNAWLDRLCREKGLDLSETSPGPDGFAIEVADEGGRQIVLIGGSNDRGVIYGQDAFFDLLRSSTAPGLRPPADGVSFPVVSVRDWPSIAWRGRPYIWIQRQLAPGALDASVRARLNFLDIRDTGRKGPVGLEPRTAQSPVDWIHPGASLDRDACTQLLSEAHRRGQFVYGVVACAAERDKFAAVLGTYEELIRLGVDGLWISFDDPGSREGAEELVAQIAALAARSFASPVPSPESPNPAPETPNAKRGTRDAKLIPRLAVTPPMNSYSKIETAWNKQFAALPSLRDARWFFTRVPCEADAKAAKEFGLTRLPSWWHNWPIYPAGGFLHLHESGDTLRVGPSPAYTELPPLAVGWHSPSYEILKDAPRYADAAMMWGNGNEEYLAAAFGIWAWHPERHDWAATARAIYSWVFGPAQAAAAQAFDEKLSRLKTLFIVPQVGLVPDYNWPPRLKRSEDRREALKLVDELDELAKGLSVAAPEETMLEPARLEALYLEPMRATASYARKMAVYQSPAAALNEMDDTLASLLADGDAAAAEKEFAKARGPLLWTLDKAEADFGDLWGIKDWLAKLRPRLASFAGWQAYAAGRQKDTEKRFADFFRGPDCEKQVLAVAAQRPPADGLRPTAVLPPGDWARQPALARGFWTAGVVKAGDAEAVGVAHPFPGGWVPMIPGEYAEVRAELPLPKSEGPLELRFPLVATSREVGPGGVVAELWANGERLAERDMAVAAPAGNWFNVDVTAAAKGAERLKLRFRVVNRHCGGRFDCIVYLGPGYLCPQK